nr:basic chitinase [Oryza sativa]
MRALAVVAMVARPFLAAAVHAEQCGSQAGGAVCPNCLCCSQFGWCGSTSDYCGAGCQSQCSRLRRRRPDASGGGGSGVASIVSRSLFDLMLLHRNDAACPASNFYTYDAFVAAASAFPGFAAAGDADTNKREVAAFLAQTSHETTGGWATAPDGPYTWGYCFKEENGGAGPDYCQQSAQWPCAAGKKYYGRGPIQLSYNFNYGPAGQAIGADLLGDPDLVASDATVSFDTAFWFWMTPQSPKPSCNAVATGQWTPSADDQRAGRVPGYGVITNIINGGLECGHGEDDRIADRIGFYKRYCDILGVSYGANLDCYSQRPSAPPKLRLPSFHTVINNH